MHGGNARKRAGRKRCRSRPARTRNGAESSGNDYIEGRTHSGFAPGFARTLSFARDMRRRFPVAGSSRVFPPPPRLSRSPASSPYPLALSPPRRMSFQRAAKKAFSLFYILVRSAKPWQTGTCSVSVALIIVQDALRPAYDMCQETTPLSVFLMCRIRYLHIQTQLSRGGKKGQYDL